MNTFFQYKDAHKYMWYTPREAQKPLIDFCIISSDLFSEGLDATIKRRDESSTDHQLVVCSL